MADRPNYHHVLVPINFLQWDRISVRSRVLLAMSVRSDNKSHMTYVMAGELARLLGFVDENGVETEEGMKAVRQARQALTKTGALRHSITRKGGVPHHSWEILCQPLKPGLDEVFPSKNIVDLWADAEPRKAEEAPKPSKPSKVEEVGEEEVEEEEVEEEEVEEPKPREMEAPKPSKVVEEEEDPIDREAAEREAKRVAFWSQLGVA